VLADGLDLLASTDLRAALPALSVPTLWLGGRRDRVVDPRAMAAAAAQVPDARVVVVDHAGHAPFLTHADAVAAELRAFGGSAGPGTDA
jgi:pimeloyl-[acyl-carrier protein] methyl ester esterase